MRTLGQEIRNARARAGKTLRGTARELGVSPAFLSIVEQDKHKPPESFIMRIAAMFGTDADRWCALVGTIPPDLMRDLARVGREDPELFRFFRTLVKRKRGR